MNTRNMTRCEKGKIAPLTRNGKALSDLELLYLLGKKTLEEQEKLALTGSRLPYTNKKYDPEVVKFAQEIAKAKDNNDYTDTELSQIVSNSLH